MAEDNIEREMNSELYNYNKKTLTNKVVPDNKARDIVSNIIDKNMDSNNKRIALIMKDKKNGMGKAVKEMFSDKKGKVISYSEMREKYG